MSMTLASLVSSCPAPVSTAEGVSRSIEWFEVASIFAINHSEKQSDPDSNYLANAMYVRNLCEVYTRNTELNTTDYTSLNNRLMHVKWALDATTQYNNG